ncbi:MAG: hypothetical protein ACI9GW_000574 [Halieaceae bacterium]
MQFLALDFCECGFSGVCFQNTIVGGSVVWDMLKKSGEGKIEMPVNTLAVLTA